MVAGEEPERGREAGGEARPEGEGLGGWLHSAFDAGVAGPVLSMLGVVYGSMDRRLGMRAARYW